MNPLRIAIEKMIAEGKTHRDIAKMIGCATDTLYRIKKDTHEQSMQESLRLGIEKVFGKDVADWFNKKRIKLKRTSSANRKRY